MCNEYFGRLHDAYDGSAARNAGHAFGLDLLRRADGARRSPRRDLEPPGSQALMNELPLHYDVILAPHHGSAYSVAGGNGSLGNAKLRGGRRPFRRWSS